jgi:hypothetical protein
MEVWALERFVPLPDSLIGCYSGTLNEIPFVVLFQNGMNFGSEIAEEMTES